MSRCLSCPSEGPGWAAAPVLTPPCAVCLVGEPVGPGSSGPRGETVFQCLVGKGPGLACPEHLAWAAGRAGAGPGGGGFLGWEARGQIWATLATIWGDGLKAVPLSWASGSQSFKPLWGLSQAQCWSGPTSTRATLPKTHTCHRLGVPSTGDLPGDKANSILVGGCPSRGTSRELGSEGRVRS